MFSKNKKRKFIKEKSTHNLPQKRTGLLSSFFANFIGSSLIEKLWCFLRYKHQSNFLKYAFFSGTLLPLFYLFSLYALTNSCAQQQALTGGKRDTIPPKLIEALSTPNFQTNFKKQDIDLVFDEYIEIRNVVKQVVVSPPLDSRIPKVERQKGFKTARFIFDDDEVLKEGVTYAINFGEAIQDLTESNKVKDLQFLFSTGDYIDSLKMSGKVIDVLTGKPVENVLFMLYQNFADTVVRTEKPYYFGRTDKDGKFEIKYLKAGSFKGFALEDQDLNYLFNLPKEKIGFTLDTIQINDSVETQIDIQLFEEYTPLNKPKIDISTYGLVKIGFRREPYDAVLTYDSIGQEIYQETEGDTIRYWYDLQDSIPWNFYFQRDTLIDTLKVRGMRRNLTPIALSRARSSEEKIPINPFKNIPLSFTHPIKNIDTAFFNFSKITTTQIQIDSASNSLLDSTAIDTSKLVSPDNTIKPTVDTLSEKFDSSSISLSQEKVQISADFKIDSIIKRIIHINYDWEENNNFQLEILPGGITDWYDAPNQDTILLNYEVKAKTDFGTINLTVTEMDSTQTYWCQLLFRENVVEEFLISNNVSYKQSFPALLPGKYSLKVIEDLNGNSRWDSGNYDLKLQPEKISTANIEELRAGWDVEAEVKIDFSEQKKEGEDDIKTEDSN